MVMGISRPGGDVFADSFWQIPHCVPAQLSPLPAGEPDDATFRLMADFIPCLCWIANGDGYIVWYNQRWHAYCGTTAEEMEGWGWTTVHDPRLLSSVMRRWKESLEEGRPFEMTFPLRGSDGIYRPFLTRVQPIRDLSGHVVRWFGTNTEISDLVEAQTALRSERDLSRTILEGMSEGFELLDRDYTILDVNSVAEPMTPFAKADLIGRNHLEVYPGSENSEFFRACQKAMEDRRPFTINEEFVTSDRQHLWFEIRGFPVQDKLALFFLNETRHRKLEGELTEALRRLDAILANTRQAVFLMDERQHCIYANQSAEKLTGYTFEEMQGRPLHEVVHHTRPDGTHYPIDECPIDSAFPEGAQTEGEETFVHKDGSFYPVAFTASPIRDSHSNTVGTIIEARNIAAEKEQQQQLTDALRNSEALLYEVNHRVKNSLQMVASLLMLQARRADGEGRALLEEASARVKVLGSLHQRLYQTSEHHRIELVSFLRELVHQTLSVMAHSQVPKLRFHGQGEIHLSIETAVPLSLIASELVTNAAKYGLDQVPCGHLDVWVSRLEDRVEVTIADDGPGLPEGFEPADSQGLGMRIVLALCRQIRADFSIGTTPCGASFTVSVPIQAEAP